jgi:DNA-binding transcriptional ArsR family regulator
MIADPVRRKILSVLADEQMMSRSDLGEVLASDEDIPAADTHDLEMSLHHNHLPKLTDDNYIEYDTRTGDVVLWKDPQRIRAHLYDE